MKSKIVFEIGEVVKGRNCGTFRVMQFDTINKTRGAYLKEVASWNHELESPSPPMFFTLDMIVKIDSAPLTMENSWLADIEIHVADQTFHVSKIIKAETKEEALEKFEQLAKDRRENNDDYQVQVKSMFGLLKDNLELLEEL